MLDQPNGLSAGNSAAQDVSTNVFTPYNTPHSPLMFPVGLRRLAWEGRDGTHKPVGSHHALIRLTEDGRGADVLNVVSSTYKLVHNRELFGVVEDTLTREMPASAINGVMVKDKVAYNGKSCWREYVFPGLASDIGAKSKIAFRVIVQNGYGGSALRVLAGAIEFWCSNGMVRGSYDTAYYKHTSGLQIERMGETVTRSIDTYAESVREWREWTRKPVTREQTMDLFKAIAKSPSHFDKLSEHWMRERESRGSTLWAAYSTLTYYASHNDGSFALRRSNTDNADAIMMQRELDVSNWTQHEAFQALVTAE